MGNLAFAIGMGGEEDKLCLSNHTELKMSER